MEPQFTRQQTIEIFEGLIRRQTQDLERIQKRPFTKHTAKRIESITAAMENCYAALYYLQSSK